MTDGETLACLDGAGTTCSQYFAGSRIISLGVGRTMVSAGAGALRPRDFRGRSWTPCAQPPLKWVCPDPTTSTPATTKAPAIST